MSRFFRGGSTDSDSDSDSTQSSSSDAFSSDEEEHQEQKKKTGASRFMVGAQDSDSDESSDDSMVGKKAVRSAKDKRFDEMRQYSKTISNALKVDDWVLVQTEYDKLTKAYLKATAMIDGATPRFYVRLLARIDDRLVGRESNRKMNVFAAKALNALKQKMKKTVKQFEQDLINFRSNPVDEDESEAEAIEHVEETLEDTLEETLEETVEDDDGFTVVKKKKTVALNAEAIFTKLDSIQASRGKKGTDKLEQIELLLQLLQASTTPYQQLRVLLILLPVRLEYVPPKSGVMHSDMWKSALANVNSMLDILDSNPHITLSVTAVNEVLEAEHLLDDRISDGLSVVLPGNIASFVDRLDDEFTKSLQTIDPHSIEYVERLRDETVLYAALLRAQLYAEATTSLRESSDMLVMRRVEHLYFKPPSLIKLLEDQVRKAYPALKAAIPATEVVSKLCLRLYTTPVDRIRTRALLCHVYHYALRDDYHKAHDMMLMSHLHENIFQADIQTQILYNRALVQIGLCAFRAGLFREASFALQDISSSGKVRELLAQGIHNQKHVEKTSEQEKLERDRQLPFHMHVNLELLEAVYLTSAMLLEVPNMAFYTHESRKKVISKPFRRMFDYHDRQVFVGPPENTRDHIMAAAKAMAVGEWKQCRDYINAIKIWDLLPNADKIKETLSTVIQEETLRTYVFSYSKHYDSFGIASLGSMFDLDEAKVTCVLSKMIINEELQASLDAPTNTVVLHRNAPGNDMTRLQHLAGVYTEKLSNFVDSNEKLLESRSILLGLQEQQQQLISNASGQQQGASRGRRFVGGNARVARRNLNGSQNMGFHFKAAAVGK